jgi:hypothetical protein
VIPDKRAPHWRTGRTTPAEKAGIGLSPAIVRVKQIIYFRFDKERQMSEGNKRS